MKFDCISDFVTCRLLVLFRDVELDVISIAEDAAIVMTDGVAKWVNKQLLNPGEYL